MTNSRNLNRCYLVLAALCVAAAVYYFAVLEPLGRRELEIDARAEEVSASLVAAGNGMSAEEVARSIETIEADIAAFSEIGKERAQTIQLSPEAMAQLEKPFQLLDFEERRFLVAADIRKLAADAGVKLFDGWENSLPSYKSDLERPDLLWVKLDVIEQLLRAVIAAGVGRVDVFEIVSLRPDGERASPLMNSGEVPVRMQLTGKMEAIHDIVMALPLRAEEMENLSLNWSEGPKSTFFLNRFILKKSSKENPDEVSLDFVASGYFDTTPEQGG